MRKLLLFFGLAALIFAVGGVAFAQTSAPATQMVITWRAAHSYVPPGYSGKALPNQSSPIMASVEVFTNGARVNLSNVTIYWYLDSTLLGGTVGTQTISFNPFGSSGSSEVLKVEMPDYPGGLLISTTEIPITQPTVVIDAPYANGAFAANPLALDALPYFFNVSSMDQLAFAWMVNGQTSSNAENPNFLQATLGPGTQAGTNFDIQLTATNAADGTGASDETGLTYQPLR